MQFGNILKILVAGSLIAFCNVTNSAVITFTPLSGDNGAPYTGHMEAGFTVTQTQGDSREDHVFGNPIPSIRSAVPVTIMVTESSGRPFTFSSFDFSSSNSRPSSYNAVGKLGDLFITDLRGVLRLSSFYTINNDQQDRVVDKLTFNFRNGIGAPFFAVDNIVVQVVPLPAALWLFGSALGLLGWFRRRTAS